jgi:hypothetical protein
MKQLQVILVIISILLVVLVLKQKQLLHDIEQFGFFDKIKSFFSPSNSMPSKVSSILTKIGSSKVTKITVCRTPVQKALQQVLNVVSLGQFNKNVKKYNYDELFHLYIIVDYIDQFESQASCIGGKCSAKAEQILASNVKSVKIEKNAVVEINPIDARNLSSAECIVVVPIPSDLTINDLIFRAEKFHKARYYRTVLEKEGFWLYDAANNNCQIFIYSILTSNGLMNPIREKFIMQHAADILKDKYGVTKPFARFVTDLGAVAEKTIMQRL